jgi:hypothetical protein
VILTGRAWRRFTVWLLWEPRDLWVGVFWKPPYDEGPSRWLELYVCVVPMLPLRLNFRLPDRSAT